MAGNSSLGIFIEETLIKYAKIVKERDFIKVEAFNVVFYDNLGEALNKVINETYSFKIPICINISNELYNYYEIFSMLNKKDIKKTIDIEFDMFCNDKNYNKNSLVTKYILVNEKDNNEKLKAIHIAANKTDISRKLQLLNESKVFSIAPISTSITNLLDIGSKDNIAIINIENETKITTILDGQIYRVDTIEYGMGQILDEINKTENSMQKSYEVCKNITLYTQETQNLQSEENEHLDQVMPILYKIATECKKIIDSSFHNISKVYITGLGTAINNIDLYFQEYMVNLKCEVLHPFFVEGASVKIPVKDYIEVNSAIALAMDGLGYGNKELNFAQNGIDISNIKLASNKLFKDGGNLFSLSFSGELSVFEKLFLRLTTAFILISIIYSIFSITTIKQIDKKTEEVNNSLSMAKTELSKIDKDALDINNRIQTYNKVISTINDLTDKSAETLESRIIPKDAIPNLLNRIMFIIPQKVVITSIKNTTDNHIVIEAQAEKYEQLGYFKALIDSKGILEDVKSTSGTKDGNLVKVTIEGELP